MKKILALLLVCTFSYLAFNMVSQNNLIADYGNANTHTSVSSNYIDKSVQDASNKSPQSSTEAKIFGSTSNAETGSANMVTSIVVNYRSFDTLGEVTVLFISALGVSLLVGSTGQYIERSESGFILKTATRLLAPLLLIVGIYVITHGHLTPGGGFQGGSMIASAVLLLFMSDHTFVPNMRKFKLLEGLSGSIYIVLGLSGMVLTGFFLKNFIATGTIGNLMSGGLVPIIYLFIGLKVGSELTSILSDFLKEEANI